MKARAVLAFILIACLAGLAWWLFSVSATEPEKTAATFTAGPAAPLANSTAAVAPLTAVAPGMNENLPVPVSQNPSRMLLPPTVNAGMVASPANNPNTPSTLAAGSGPIRFAAEPANGSVLVMARLQSLAPQQPRYAGQLGDPSKLKLLPPIATYNLRLDFLDQSGNLDSSVQLMGFDYVVLASGQPFAAVIVTANQSGKALKVTDINIGPFVAATAKALAQLPTLDQLHGGSYEARYLKGSGLFEAIWLKSDSGGSDFIYLLAPRPPLEAGKLYPVGDFLKSVLVGYHHRQTQGGFD